MHIDIDKFWAHGEREVGEETETTLGLERAVDIFYGLLDSVILNETIINK